MRADVRACGHGSNRLCPSSRRRSRASAGHRRGSQSPAQTCAARAHCPLFGRPLACAGSGERRMSVSRPMVWRWQALYAEQGVKGLLRDRTRKPGRAPLSAKVVAKVLDPTCSEPPGHATHWTGRAMAKAVGGRQPARGAALVAGASAAAAPHPHLQALQRSRVRREGRGRRRPLHGSAQARGRGFDRRGKPDPGARLHAAGPAAQARKNA